MKFKDFKGMEEENNLYFKWKDGVNIVRIVSEITLIWKAHLKDKSVKKFMLEANAERYNATATSEEEYAKPRGLFYVINRETNDIQIMEVGTMILKRIADLAVKPTYEFDDLPPYDLIITKTGSKLATRYEVDPARTNTPLTEEEKRVIATLEDLTQMNAKDAVDGTQVRTNQ